ncbi:MAG TPA: alpha/beta hydrolase [Gemmatimonadaceae bacterium]|jgi:pimeloyl-ACP methyl ester carboxylesterase
MRSEQFDLPVSDHHLRVRRLSVGETPTATTLVFLHDSLGSIALWRDFPDRLVEQLRLDAIVFDRRGYGRSSPFAPAPRTPRYLEEEGERLGDVLEQLGVSSAILFGHSDGGSIALIAAALYPTLVRAIITEGAHVFVEERTLDGIRAVREMIRTTDMREKLARYHGTRTDTVISAWIDTWLSPEFRDWNIESYLPRVQCPALAIQGSDDEFGTERQLEAIVGGIPAWCGQAMIHGVGHTPHRDAPSIVIDATTRFLKEALGASGRVV